jgi:hypothetical protein
VLGADVGEQHAPELGQHVRPQQRLVAANGGRLAAAVVLNVAQPLRGRRGQSGTCPAIGGIVRDRICSSVAHSQRSAIGRVK